MRPRDFAINSDYLTIANIENDTFTATIPSGVVPSGQIYSTDFTFTYKNIPQTITRAYMHHSKWQDETIWGVGKYGDTNWKSGNTIFYERMFITTPTDSTVKLHIEIQAPTGTTIPNHTITIKIFRFKVPNVF